MTKIPIDGQSSSDTRAYCVKIMCRIATRVQSHHRISLCVHSAGLPPPQSLPRGRGLDKSGQGAGQVGPGAGQVGAGGWACRG